MRKRVGSGTARLLRLHDMILGAGDKPFPKQTFLTGMVPAGSEQRSVALPEAAHVADERAEARVVAGQTALGGAWRPCPGWRSGMLRRIDADEPDGARPAVRRYGQGVSSHDAGHGGHHRPATTATGHSPPPCCSRSFAARRMPMAPRRRMAFDDRMPFIVPGSSPRLIGIEDLPLVTTFLLPNWPA